MICDTKISFELIQVECRQPNPMIIRSFITLSKMNDSMMINVDHNNDEDSTKRIDKNIQDDSTYHGQQQQQHYHHQQQNHQNPSIHYNLKIFKDK